MTDDLMGLKKAMILTVLERAGEPLSLDEIMEGYDELREEIYNDWWLYVSDPICSMEEEI